VTTDAGFVPRHAVVSWSGGKDSAMALWRARQMGWGIDALLTTVGEAYGRVSIHGVRVELLERQAAALGLPVRQVALPTPCTNLEYEARMGTAVRELLAAGTDAFVFGDLFLEDIRAYREAQLATVGARALFPVWGADTVRFARDVIDAGFRGRVASLDPRRVDRALAGAAYDRALLQRLAPDVDPCGENGEFHTFVWDGPVFATPVPVTVGAVVERDGFVYADLLPG